MSIAGLKQWARGLKREVVALWIAGRDPRVPWHAKAVAAAVAAYALSPIDLIPDFIPVLGQLDDALVVALALRSIAGAAGPAVLREHWPGPEASLRTVLRLAGAGP